MYDIEARVKLPMIRVGVLDDPVVQVARGDQQNRHAALVMDVAQEFESRRRQLSGFDQNQEAVAVTQSRDYTLKLSVIILLAV